MIPPAVGNLLRRAWDLVSQERGLVLGLLILVGSVWTFIGILDEVLEGEAREIDERVATLLTNHAGEPIGPPWLVHVALDLTALGGGAVLVLMIGLSAGYLVLTGNRRHMWMLLAASTLGMLLSAGLKSVIGRERPDQSLHLAEVTSASFPSGHAMLGAIVWLTLAAVVSATRPRVRERLYIVGAALFIAGIIGFTRVYLRVHYTTDVLAGWSVGLAWTVLWLAAARWMKRRNREDREEESTPDADGDTP